jgi:uncharacterized membrane protein YraQ (UPF0718 family)
MAILILLWSVVVVLAVIAASHGRDLLVKGGRDGAVDFVKILPRVALGVIAAGYIAAAVPQDLMIAWLGPNSGLTGVTVATLAGALTPGGPVVGFSIGAAALKGGAGAPQVIAYATAWALYAIPRIITFELPMMPPRVVWLRALVSIPLPFLAAAGAMLLGKP